MNTNKVLTWLKDFRCSWLPKNLSNNKRLTELINNKIHELEQLLLIENNQNENEILLDDNQQRIKPNDKEQILLSTEQRSLPTPPDIIHYQVDDEHEKKEPSYRPIIRIKRIALDEAKQFLSPEWKITKSKRKTKRKPITNLSNRKRSKKNSQTNKTLPLPNQDQSLNNSIATRKSPRTKKIVEPPSNNAVTNTAVINNNHNNHDKPKKRKKLRRMDGEDDDLIVIGNNSQSETLNGIDNDCEQVPRFIGHNGILSQSRQQNDTTTTTIIDDDNHDFTFRIHSRQSNNFKRKSIDYPTIPTEPISLDGDINPIASDEEDEILQNIIESNDNESLFASLDIQTNEKTVETTSNNNNPTLDYNDGIEDITNDGVDPPPSTSSPNIGFVSLTT